MTIQSDYTVGLGKETTYGTAVAPTRFYSADATLKETVETVQGKSHRPGHRVARAAARPIVKRESSGDITLDAMSVGLGFILAAFFGGATTTQIGATAAHQQVHTMRKSDWSDSYTIQQGIPRLGSSVVDAYTYAGAQCASLDIEAKDAQIVSIKSSWIARSLVLDQPLAPASYPAALELFTYVGGAVALGGGAFTAPTATALATGGAAIADVREVSLSLSNGLDSNGFNLGSGGRRSRPAAYRGGAGDAISGSLTLEYSSRTFVDAYLAQADLSLILTFQGTQEIAEGIVPVLQLVVPLVRLDGDVPTSNDGDVITVQHRFTGLSGAIAPEPVYAVYRSLDTAP